jgi:hypothetical protein
MFDFLTRRKYKNQVLGSLHSLLYLYPRGRDKIIKDYPGIHDSIKSSFTEGVSPQRAALFAAAAILANLVETLSSDQRALIYGQLQRVDMRQIKAILKELMAELSFG